MTHKRQVTHLDCHGAHDGPLVPLERLERHLRDLLVRLAQELLARRQQHLLVLALDLDLLRAADSNVSLALTSLMISVQRFRVRYRLLLGRQGPAVTFGQKVRIRLENAVYPTSVF